MSNELDLVDMTLKTARLNSNSNWSYQTWQRVWIWSNQLSLRFWA